MQGVNAAGYPATVVPNLAEPWWWVPTPTAPGPQLIQGVPLPNGSGNYFWSGFRF